MKRLLPLLMLATAMAASAIAATGRLEVKDLSDTIAWGHDTTGMRNTCQMIVVHSNYYAGRDRSQWDLQGCIDQFRQYDVAPHYMIDRQGIIVFMHDFDLRRFRNNSKSACDHYDEQNHRCCHPPYSFFCL